jgi:tRNA threonylcarbamoyladenosine biosynthesis protein TsaB
MMSQMLLSVNTTTLQYGLALVMENGTVRTEYMATESGGHFGGLIPALNFLFTRTDSDPRHVKALGVGIGPGSFTGLRVGLSMVKGMSQALGIPIIGIPSLEALASQIAFSNDPIAPVIDSRKGELFTARFDSHHEGKLLRTMEDCSLRIDDFPEHFPDTTLFVGNNYERQEPLLRKMFGEKARFPPDHFWNLRPSTIGSLALKRYLAGDFDDAPTLSPIYLRPPDIRPNRYAAAGL